MPPAYLQWRSVTTCTGGAVDATQRAFPSGRGGGGLMAPANTRSLGDPHQEEKSRWLHNSCCLRNPPKRGWKQRGYTTPAVLGSPRWGWGGLEICAKWHYPGARRALKGEGGGWVLGLPEPGFLWCLDGQSLSICALLWASHQTAP